MYTICQAAGLGKALLCPAERALVWPTCSAGYCDLPVERRLVVLLTVGYNTHVLIGFSFVFFLLPDGLAKKFGLTPEQFGENLRDSYQRHETEQFPAEPLELAKDYVCRSVCGGLCGGPVDITQVRGSGDVFLSLHVAFLLVVNSQAQKLCWKELGTWWLCRSPGSPWSDRS